MLRLAEGFASSFKGRFSLFFSLLNSSQACTYSEVGRWLISTSSSSSSMTGLKGLKDCSGLSLGLLEDATASSRDLDEVATVFCGGPSREDPGLFHFSRERTVLLE